MVRLFKDDSTRASRALQIWLILISKAANRQTITYGELAEKVGYRGAGVFAPILDHIMYYCDQNALPALTALLASQDTGLPGEGLITSTDHNMAREEVFRYDWFGVIPPTPEELRKAHQSGTA